MKDERQRARFALPLLAACMVIYAAAVAGYAVWAYRAHKVDLMAGIDSDLLQAARSLKYLLAPDFHDRALDTNSIAMDEELKNRKAVTDFGVESGFKWVYTLAEKDGQYFFAAPSVSEEEALELASWYFYPYDDVPPEFIAAFRENKTVFVEYTDQWGTFRSVALPQQSPGGRRYLACADKEIGDIAQLLRKSLLQSVAIALFFLLTSLPFLWFLSFLHRTHTAELKKLNAELRTHKEHLEELVQARTAALEQETRLLQEALANVKVLRGLLPICASCKKIRDDKGYWNQLEGYIQENSDAEFSHGLCPDCVQTLYPDLDLPPSVFQDGPARPADGSPPTAPRPT
ncbi:MAG: hypothetical protein EOM72_11730 [Opitutae bacterium]|nr:hypothetical protein [Opitutae bacterium]